MAITKIVINFFADDFIIEKDHPYTVKFSVACPVFHNSKFELNYTGADLETTVSIQDCYLKKFKEEMQEHFGYGPFDKRDIKKKLEEKSHFSLSM